MLALAYEHPLTGEPEHDRQVVRIVRDQPFELEIGERADGVSYIQGGRPDLSRRRRQLT